MDDYQKHLERQLQQQQQQIRNQVNDLHTPRPLQQHTLLQQQQQQQQQRHQPPPPQWPANNIVTGAPPPSGPPGAPGFGRGLPGNPMSVHPVPQQQTQAMTQAQINAFSSSSQTNVQTLQNQVQTPSQKSQGSPAPGSPVPGDTQAEKARISTILEINSHLIKICLSLQSTVPAQNIATDPTYAGCLARLGQNLSYLAAIADRANKAESAQKPIPVLTLMTSPPMIRVVDEKESLDKLYARLSSLQSAVDSTNGDNASGSSPGSQVNSPRARSRQTSAGSQGQHVATPTMPRSQLPGHAQHNTPSPHLGPSQLHGQSGLNPNHPRQAQPQPQQFQQNFAPNQQFPSQHPQFQQLAQHPQFQQLQSSQFTNQNPNQQFPQQTQNQSFPQNQTFQPTQNQFQQNHQFQQNPPSFQQQPQFQPRVPSRPPSRPSSRHSLGHPASPSISPRPTNQPLPGPSPQLTSTPTPPNPSPRSGIPNPPVDLTPEQTAVLQERARIVREARIQQMQQAQQNASRATNLNLFAMQNGIQNQPNGFSPFQGNIGGMMNGMSSTSPPAQNQNFGGGSSE